MWGTVRIIVDSIGPQQLTRWRGLDTSARLLRLLAVFTTRPRWAAEELADRLDVTTRTLRRDVVRLRGLGYPIVSSTGRYGGYALGSGGHLPPLLLDDDEAMAVLVALEHLSSDADPLLGEAALSAATKLSQVLPNNLRARIETLRDVVVGVRPRQRYSAAPVRAVARSVLMALATSCRRSERVAFDYVDSSERRSVRRVEPHRLVSLGRQWYLVGYDLDRDDWRTYRVDRVSQLVATGHRNSGRETPDAAALVQEGVSVRAFGSRTRIRLHAPLDVASSHIGPTIGFFDPADAHDDHCIVTIGGDADWVARFLVSLPMPFDVLGSEDVRAEICVIARGLIGRHGARPVDRDSI